MLTPNRDDNSSQIVYLNTQVYSGTPAQCTPPCLFVLAPSGLPSPTTIDLPAYITSIEVVPGTTTTITIQAPPLTVSSMQYSNVPVSSGQPTSSFEAPISLDVPPLTTTVTAPGGAVFTTIFSLPPWPAMSHGPNWNGSTSGQSGGQPAITAKPPLDAPTPQPPVKTTTGTTSPTTTGVVQGSWPTSGEFTPVPEDIPDEGEDDDGDGGKSKTTCKLWFFFVSYDSISRRTPILTKSARYVSSGMILASGSVAGSGICQLESGARKNTSP